ncbi:MAG: hypothetical protein B7Y00_01070 [Sphingomonadales bacterium 17-56-6]|nr:MAG: hypothetical protein B7Y00_01070 [Sphingomonadales bacterium 17-56-6]
MAGPPLLVVGLAAPFMGLTPTANAHIAASSPPVAQSNPTPASKMSASPEPKPSTDGSYSKRELSCLASAIYHEARSEPIEGQIAVAEVIIARSRDGRWKDSLCGTITMRRQFSFVRNGRAPAIPEVAAATKMEQLAKDVVAGHVSSRAKGALYFHASYADPSWRHRLTKRIRIKKHIFYEDATS